MSEEINENSEVYNHYLELSKPNEEDFQRVFSEGELKELCLKHKCRVDMWRWNVVADYRKCFTDTGRYQRWSERDRLRMLAKAVNRMKPAILYEEEEIANCRKEEWGLQLKENILSLNFWKRQRLQRNEVLTESVEIEQQTIEAQNDNIDDESLVEEIISEEIPLGFEVHTESANASNLIIQTQRPQQESSNERVQRESDDEGEEILQLGFEVHTESANASNLIIQTQRQQQESVHESVQQESDEVVEEVLTCFDNSDDILVYESDSEPEFENIENNLQKQTKPLAEYEIHTNSENDDDGDSQDSILTVANKDVKVLQSEEVAPEIENIYGINTLSMTMDSQMATQSTQNLPIEQSQDVIPHSYDNFKNIIPLTSTQSQNFESQDIDIES